MFGKPLDGLSQGFRLRVLSYLYEVVLGIRVLHPGDVLLNDGTLIEILGDKVGSCSNELHTSGVSLGIRVCTLEAGEEGVVDVDDSALELLAEFRAEDLHVAGENNQLNLLLSNELAQPVLKCNFVACSGDRMMLKANAEEFG